MLIESDDLELLELILSVLDHPLFYSEVSYIACTYPIFEEGSLGTCLVDCSEVWGNLYLDLKHVELHKEIDQNYTLQQL